MGAAQPANPERIHKPRHALPANESLYTTELLMSVLLITTLHCANSTFKIAPYNSLLRVSHLTCNSVM